MVDPNARSASAAPAGLPRSVVTRLPLTMLIDALPPPPLCAHPLLVDHGLRVA